MAELNFYMRPGAEFSLMGPGSGLGFFGDDGFGDSVAVGEYQGRTYVTDGNGIIQGPECNNVKYYNAQSGILGQTGSGIHLRAIPNYQSTLNIRFTNASAVKVQNAKLRIYDRVNIYNPASGVTTKAAQICHPSFIQGLTGSGNSSWVTFNEASISSFLTMANSPGLSGQSICDGSGSVYAGTRHDWYVALSASPDSIGSKTQYGLYFSTEYL